MHWRSAGEEGGGEDRGVLGAYIKKIVLLENTLQLVLHERRD